MFFLATAGPFIYICLQRRAERFLLSRTARLQEELQTTQQKLLQAERLAAAGTLASGLAHEIKNPLTSIKAFTAYLEERYDDPDFRKKFTKIVPSELDRINSVVKQLLEFSSPTFLKLKNSDIHNVLDDTLTLISLQLDQSDIKLTKEYAESIPSLNIDPERLKQAFLNLFLNAVEAMPNGGKLAVETAVSGDQLAITVSDTGKGIPSQDLPRIFDAFYSKKDKGTGLGLAITYGIVKNHKGQISVKSTPGIGTTFTLTLPITT